MSSIDLVPASRAIAQLANELSASLGPAIKAIGDAVHLSFHSSLNNFWFHNRMLHAYAELDLARWVVPGSERHTAVKAARDELKRLRKAEIRYRGWKR